MESGTTVEFAEGISKLKSIDIKFAEEFGYQVKLLTVLKDREKGLEYIFDEGLAAFCA